MRKLRKGGDILQIGKKVGGQKLFKKCAVTFANYAERPYKVGDSFCCSVVTGRAVSPVPSREILSGRRGAIP